MFSAKHQKTARQGAVIVAAVAQAVLPTVLGPRFEADEQPPNVLQPAPTTFAVWLPIFATSLWHARVQGLPRHAGDLVFRKVSSPAAVAYAATGLWAPLVRGRRYWPAQFALFVVAGAAEVARRRVAAAQSERSISDAAGRVANPADRDAVSVGGRSVGGESRRHGRRRRSGVGGSARKTHRSCVDRRRYRDGAGGGGDVARGFRNAGDPHLPRHGRVGTRWHRRGSATTLARGRCYCGGRSACGGRCTRSPSPIRQLTPTWGQPSRHLALPY